MIKFQTYNEFVYEQKKHNWSGRFNKSSMDNNYVGSFGHTFNKIENVGSIEDAEKILKERGIKYVERIEALDGMAHYRAKPKWTKFVAGVEPKDNETYTSGMTVAAYDPKSKRLFTEPTDMMKDYKNDPHLCEGGVVNPTHTPIYDEPNSENIPVEKRDPKEKQMVKVIEKLLKELYGKALDCDCDGHRLKDTLYPKYKGTKIKMNITEEGKFIFDSFGRFPDIIINLKNMKKGNHTQETILKEVKKHISKMDERIQGMPSMSQIASFEE